MIFQREKIQALLGLLRERKLIAFVGSGLSIGMPSWPDLLNRMIKWGKKHGVTFSQTEEKELKGLIKKNDLLLAAEEIKQRLQAQNRDYFINFMKETFDKPVCVSSCHKLIFKIPFSSIITTNYDTFLETAYSKVKGELPKVFTQTKVRDLQDAISKRQHFILKMHGTIDDSAHLVLGRTDYREFMFNNEQFKFTIQQMIQKNSFLFIGYGLNDPDLLVWIDQLRVAFNDNVGQHFALLNCNKIGEIQRARYKEDYGIEIIPYYPKNNKHPQVLTFLELLKKRK
jgi:hypothetical protein